MENTTWLITVSLSICIVIFGILAVVGSIYGILVWYPRYRQNRIDVLKANGRQYEVDKLFTFPTHILGKLEEGKVVAVWVDSKEPRNLDKIAIHIK